MMTIRIAFHTAVIAVFVVVTLATANDAPRATEPDDKAAAPAPAAPMPPPTPAAGTVSFRRDIAPLLVEKCQACHGPDKSESSFRVDTFARLKTAGDNELAPFTAGKPDDSELLRLIASDDKDERMPKDGEPLSAEQIALVKKWIEQGAAFDGGDENALLASIVPRLPHPMPPEIYNHPTPVTALAFAPSGTELFAAGYNEITVWNPADGTLIRRIKDVAQRTHAIAFSPDGSLLAVASGTPGRLGEVVLLNPADGSLVKVLGKAADEIFDAQFSPDGKQLATAGADRTIRIYDVASGKELRAIENHADWVMAVAWSPDGSKIASASRDKTAKVFEAATGNLIATHSGHGEPVYGVAFKADGEQVYSAGRDNKIRAWKTADGANVGEIGGFGEEVYKLVNQDGSLFASSADKSVRQFRDNDRGQVRQFDGQNDWVYSVAVHPASKRVASGGYDGQVVVWNLEDGKPIATFLAAPNYAVPAAK
ncbi:MAG: c-type cytochrome domain-containing protein [Pirellulales bacterium]